MKTWEETRKMFIAINIGFSKLPEEWKNRIDLGGAYLGGANLEGAYLRGANLRGANLEGANLRGAKRIVAVQFVGFSMYIQVEYTKIGSEYRENEEWLKMDVETAVEMGIEREYFEAYRTFLKAAMLVLKEEESLLKELESENPS